MKVIPESQLNISEIVSALKDGKTIVYPTETSYGLGCDATNQPAVDAIFAIKQRQKEKSLLVLVPHQEMAMQYAVWSPAIEDLANKYWPGPLTIVAPAHPDSDLASGVIAEDGTIAFRISSHPIAVALSQALDKPLVSTSANISGTGNPYSIDDIGHSFGQNTQQPDILIDAGDLLQHSPSTIVRVINDTVEIIRQGDIILR
jgi:L-threonylcarbamoyladenylate synthase